MIPDAEAISAIYGKFRRRQSYQDDLVLLVNWATLLEAGIPLALSLRRLGESMRRREDAVGLTMLADGIERGYHLSAMVSAYPQLFPPWWEAFLVLGERGGELPKVLRLLHRYITERMSLRQQFLTAFVSPALTSAAALGALGVFLFGLLPRLIEYLAATGATLPAPIAWYLRWEPIALETAIWALAGGTLGVLIIYQFFSSSAGRVWLDRWRLQAPIFGRLVRKYELLRVVHGIKVLVGQGASIVMGLESLAKSSNNVVVQQALTGVVRQLDQGIPLDVALATIPVMSPDAVQIIAAGWASGRLEPMLDRYAGRLSEETLHDAKDAVSAILHVTLIIVAVMVTFILLAFYLTLFFGLLHVTTMAPRGPSAS